MSWCLRGDKTNSRFTGKSFRNGALNQAVKHRLALTIGRNVFHNGLANEQALLMGARLLNLNFLEPFRYAYTAIFL